MTLLDRLQAHRGGLILIKTQLYWYDGRGWDGSPGRICLLLDAATAVAAAVATAATTATIDRVEESVALLLIDGAPHWVWMAAEDVELIDGGDR